MEGARVRTQGVKVRTGISEVCTGSPYHSIFLQLAAQFKNLAGNCKNRGIACLICVTCTARIDLFNLTHLCPTMPVCIADRVSLSWHPSAVLVCEVSVVFRNFFKGEKEGAIVAGCK